MESDDDAPLDALLRAVEAMVCVSKCVEGLETCIIQSFHRYNKRAVLALGRRAGRFVQRAATDRLQLDARGVSRSVE